MEKLLNFVGLGYCGNDHIALLPEIPLDSKVQMIEHTIQGGGPAATSTVAAARLGCNAAFISVIGDDAGGKDILAGLNAEKVDTSGMVIRPGKNSPMAYCWIDAASGKRSIAWTRGNLTELEAGEVNEDLIRKADVLHLDGHNPKGALAAARLARENGIEVSIDAGTIRDGIDDLLPLSTILIASEAFARKYTGFEDLDKALQALRKLGAPVTGITMGEAGSMLQVAGKEVLRCPAFKITPVDTNGAGDVYHGAFAVRYCECRDALESMRFASAVSALKCRKLGGRAGIPSREEVKKFLAEH